MPVTPIHYPKSNEKTKQEIRSFYIIFPLPLFSSSSSLCEWKKKPKSFNSVRANSKEKRAHTTSYFTIQYFLTDDCFCFHFFHCLSSALFLCPSLVFRLSSFIRIVKLILRLYTFLHLAWMCSKHSCATKEQHLENNSTRSRMLNAHVQYLAHLPNADCTYTKHLCMRLYVCLYACEANVWYNLFALCSYLLFACHRAIYFNAVSSAAVLLFIYKETLVRAISDSLSVFLAWCSRSHWDGVYHSQRDDLPHSKSHRHTHKRLNEIEQENEDLPLIFLQRIEFQSARDGFSTFSMINANYAAKC